jgi:hypothetical protein
MPLYQRFVDAPGVEHNVYVEMLPEPDVPPRPIPQFRTVGGLVLEPLDQQDERFKIVGSGVLLRRIGPFTP